MIVPIYDGWGTVDAFDGWSYYLLLLSQAKLFSIGKLQGVTRKLVNLKKNIL